MSSDSLRAGVEAEADRLREIFRVDWAHQPSVVEDALGAEMLALLVQLEAACTAADNLAEAGGDFSSAPVRQQHRSRDT